MYDVIFGCVFLGVYSAGISYNNRMRGNVKVYECAGSYKHVISDCDISYNDAIDTNVYTIAECGNSHSFTSVLSTNSATLM